MKLLINKALSGVAMLLVTLGATGQVLPEPPKDVLGMIALRSHYFAPARDLMERRVAFDQMMASQPVPSGVAIQSVKARGVSAELVKPEGVSSAKRRVFLYLHGGGFYSGTPATHRALAAQLAKAAAADVLVIDYRRTPEHAFPAALDDAENSYEWLLEQGYAASQTAFAGESVGGNMAIALALRLRDAKRPLPAAIVAMSPATDLEATGASYVDNAPRDPVIQKLGVIGVSKPYIGSIDPKDPRVSPLNADLRGLPPLLLQVGAGEVLLDDAVRMARKGAIDDVVVQLQVWPRMIHQWQLFPVSLLEARQALQAVADFSTAAMR